MPRRFLFLAVCGLLLSVGLGSSAAAQSAVDSAAAAAPTPQAVDTTRQAVSPPASLPAPTPPQVPGASDTLLAKIAALQTQIGQIADSVAANRGNIAANRDSLVTRSDSNAVRRAVNEVADVAKEAGETVRNLGWKVFLSLLLITLIVFLLRGLLALFEALAERSAKRRLFFKRLIPITRLIIWSVAVYLIVSIIFGVGPSGIITVLAAIGVGVAFAAQDILKNIFGGFVIILDQPFQVGDKVAVGGTYGEVVSIGLRSTRIVTPDDNLVSVPNAQIVDGQVANANAGELNLQVVTDLYLPGWVDIRLAKRIAYEAAANSKYVYLDKPIVIICKDEVNETFLLHIKVKAYVLDTRYEFLLMSDVTEAAKSEFLRHGLLTPMPLRPVLGPTYPASEPPSSDGNNTETPSADRIIVSPGPDEEAPTP